MVPPIPQTRPVWPPSPGYFRLRLVRNGWLVPAEIRLDRDGCWQAVIDGQAREPHEDPALARDVERIWTSGVRISQDQYDDLLALAAYARDHDPDHPAANPLQPIDRMTIRPTSPQPRTPKTWTT